MSKVTFDKLYENYNILSDAKDKKEHFEEYLEAIEGTKGNEKEKKLAAQIISKFFKYFPNLQIQAIEAVFDICEDDDTTIRIAAMKVLPTFCKDNKDYIGKVADILAQLLQLDDPQEYNTASNSLLQIFKEDALIAIKCIFKQIAIAEIIVREKCIKFLVTKVKTLDKSILTLEVEDIIINETKKLLQDSTADEMILLMPLLISTRLSNTLAGQQELIDLTVEQCELEEEFDPLDIDDDPVTRLLACIKFILPLFSAKLDSIKFVTYICDQVLPQWDKIATLKEGDMLQLAILQHLAELSTYCGKLENPSLHVVQIFDKLKMYMPPPPEDPNISEMPLFDFTSVECLLYAFHRLARQCPDFLTHDSKVLRDFRSRLMYFARGAQGCMKALGNLENKKDDKNLTPDQSQKLKISPKMFNNINMLIKDLFYTPPIYKCSVTLSFKFEEAVAPKKSPDKTTTKRHVPITFESNGASSKQGKSNRSVENIKLYTPPSGKFSNSFPSFGSRPRGRGGRGGMRGRSSGRPWRN